MVGKLAQRRRMKYGTDGPDQQVLLTCCVALHNKLLVGIDDLDKCWKQGVQSICSTTYDTNDGNNNDMMLGMKLTFL